jgi:hypothetical protein
MPYHQRNTPFFKNGRKLFEKRQENGMMVKHIDLSKQSPPRSVLSEKPASVAAQPRPNMRWHQSQDG